MSSALVRSPAKTLRANMSARLLAFALESQTKRASAIIKASREYAMNPPASMLAYALCDEGIATDAEFQVTTDYFEAGFDVAVELAALTLAGSADDDGVDAVEAVLDRTYARITEIIAKYYVSLSAQVDPRRDAEGALRRRSVENRRTAGANDGGELQA